MTDTEKTLKYFEKHENRLRKEIHKFLWEFSLKPYQTDLYFYPDTHDFYSFVNVGGRGWLKDNHLLLCSINGEQTEVEKGRFREYVTGTTEIVMDEVFSNLKETVRFENDNGDIFSDL